MSSKVAKFMKLLETADIVVVDDGPMLSDWEIASVEGTPDNEVAYFSWESEGESFSAILTEEGIEGATYDPEKKAFFLTDHEGNDLKINLGQYTPLAAEDWQ